MFRTVLAALLLAGCDEIINSGEIEVGTLEVCSHGIALGEGIDFTGSGQVVDAAGCTDETAHFGFDDGKTITSFGLTALDGDGNDVTPALDVSPKDTVDLLFRYDLVWGDTSGLMLSDADGLIVAAHQGAWGGGLQTGDVPGLRVSRGPSVGTRPEDCMDREAFSLTFEGDGKVEIEPVATAPVNVDGQELAALAVSSYEYVEGGTCTMSDYSNDPGSWVVSR